MSHTSTPRILLVYPSCFFYPVWMERVDLKTSLIWLGSYLSRKYPVTYADFEIQIGRPNTPTQISRFQRRVRRYLEEHEFDILAISCWTSLSYLASREVARIAREVYPDKVIVVGGYHATARPHEFMTDERLFDYVITGEGELALEQIADGYHQAGRPAEIYQVAGPPVTAEHFVPYKWELVEQFVDEHIDHKINGPCIFVSRGCPFACSFCMEPSKDRRWRAFTPDEALDEVFRLQKLLDSYSVAIADACFGMRPGWRKEFLRKLVAAQPDFWVVVETRPEYLDEEDVTLFSQLKVEIQFGLESCSPDMLLLMHKTRKPDQFLRKFSEVSNMLSDHKVLHRANLIFNHPGETHRTLEETFAYMDREIERRDSYLMWACHGFMHFPGCEIDQKRQWYESEHGTRFLCGDWWREESDQYDNSQRVIPSRDLDNGGEKLWEQMLKERDEQLKATLAPSAFRFAARKYFLEWQDDPRFQDA